ncbi:MAG TPA: c-type cytochrome [Gemmatimonadales bacterium]|nr:c-type cytochrome [Gemmatimonadales bacterium]
MKSAPLFAAVLLTTACEPPPAEHPSEPLGQGTLAAVRTSGLEAGAAPGVPSDERELVNPFADDPTALRDGERLYNAMNCTGCHGARGGGAIGPPFADRDWIYGGEPGQIFASIAQGRPNGMPSFGGRLPAESIWRVVTFVRSLSPSPDGQGGKAGAIGEGRTRDDIAGGPGGS